MNPVDAAVAFTARDYRIARSYRVPFAMNIVGVFMSLVTFRFIAKLVEGAPALSGMADYFAFVVIGMALSNVLDGALAGPGAAARQEQVQGTLELMATQPLSPAALATGWASFPLVRSFLSGGVMLLLGAAMGLRFSGADWTAGILTLVLSAGVFAALGMLGAALVLVVQQGSSVLHWISGGMSLISGVYFPLKLFPRWVSILSELSPLTHSVRAFRGALLQGKGFGEIQGDLLSLAVFAAILLPLGILSVDLAMRWARSRGTLATY